MKHEQHGYINSTIAKITNAGKYSHGPCCIAETQQEFLINSILILSFLDV